MKLVLLALAIVTLESSQASTVTIENGQISGIEFDKYVAYRGIKYATAERFELSKPFTEKWTGVKEFNSYKDICAQYDHIGYDFFGSEDCLFLNVFVPKKVEDAKEPAPVIFYIHGGAFMFGGSDFYLPDHIMENENMILVTINYRLGILGFLSAEDEALPGNLGLKDQVQALKWVQRNIEAFNGDPEKVTIVGYSAGAASVQLHYLSPQSKGLFNNGISHSGVALNPWVFMEKAREKSHKVAQFMSCPHNDHQKMVECLKKQPAKELVNSARHFQPFLYNPFSPFGVVIEPAHESAFITEHPKTLLKNGKFNQRPWLLSQTKDEGLYPAAEFYSKDEYLNEIDKDWEQTVPYILHYNDETDDTNKINKASKAIRQFYMGDRKVDKKNFAAFDDIISDRLFKFNAMEAIQLQSKFSPSYFYYFNYKSLSGLSEFMGKTTDNIGISHGEDVMLIYKSNLRSIEYSKDEKKMSRNLINMYYEFATNDQPKFDRKLIPQSKPNAVQSLEILSNRNYAVKMQDESFGNVKFWKEIEDYLQASDKINDEL